MDATPLDRLVRRAGSVMGTEQDSMVSVAEKRTLNKTLPNWQHLPPSAQHPDQSEEYVEQQAAVWPAPQAGSGTCFYSPREFATLQHISKCSEAHDRSNNLCLSHIFTLQWYLDRPIVQHGSWVFSTEGEYCWWASHGREHKTAPNFLYWNPTLPPPPPQTEKYNNQCSNISN